MTSTSTPASILMMICLTTSVGAFMSLRQLSANCSLEAVQPALPSLVGPSPARGKSQRHSHQPLMDAHLVRIPRLASLTTGRLHSELAVHLLVRRRSSISRTLRVVTLRCFVGRRTGPLTRKSLPLARSMSSWQTFSRLWTLRLVRVLLR